MQGVRRKLLQRTAKAGGLLYVAEMHGGSIHHKMDHLVCFLPGALSFMHTPSAKALLTDALLGVGASPPLCKKSCGPPFFNPRQLVNVE